MKENFAELLKEFEKNNKPIIEGQSVDGTVVEKTSSSIIVDFGHKSLGFIQKSELKQIRSDISLGDSLKAKVITLDNGSGEALLSYKVALEESAWEEAESEDAKIKVKIHKKTRNGLAGEFNFINVFIPTSLVDLSPDFNGEDLVGKEVEALVVRADRKTGTIIASRRGVQVSEHDKVDIDDVNIGDVYKVKVTRLMDFGAFVYFGGLDGLIHISDIDWSFVGDVKDHLKVGDDVEAVVVSKNNGKVSFGLKQNNMKAWDKAKEIFKTNANYEGVIKAVKKSYIIVESNGYELIVLDKHIEGGAPFHAKKKMNINDTVTVKFLEFDDERNSLICGLNLAQFKRKEVNTPKNSED